MDERENLLSETKKEIRSILLSSKNGIEYRRLAGEYEMFVGKRIRYRDLGYRDLKEFLDDIPDVVRQFIAPDGAPTVAAVADESTRHIASLVSRQRPKKGRSRSRSFTGPRLGLLSNMPNRSYARPRPIIYSSRVSSSQSRIPTFDSEDASPFLTPYFSRNPYGPLLLPSKVTCRRETENSSSHNSRVVNEPVKRSSVTNAIKKPVASESRAMTSVSKAHISRSGHETNSTNVPSGATKTVGTKAPSSSTKAPSTVPNVEPKESNSKTRIPDSKPDNSQSTNDSKSAVLKLADMKEMISAHLGKISGNTMFSRFKKSFLKQYGMKLDVTSFGYSNVGEMFVSLGIPAIVKPLGDDDFSIIPSSKPAVSDNEMVRKRSSVSVCSVTDSESSYTVKDLLSSDGKSSIHNRVSSENTKILPTTSTAFQSSAKSQGQPTSSYPKSVISPVTSQKTDLEPISQEFKNALTIVLKNSPDGILMGDLPSAIKKWTGLDVKIEETGFRSWDQLLLHLPEIVVMNYKGHGHLLLFDADLVIPDRDQFKSSSNFDLGKWPLDGHSMFPNMEANTVYPQQQNIPEDSVDPKVLIRTQTLPVGLNQSVVVYVSNVVNPGNFWFQLDGEPYCSLSALMDSLENTYNHPMGDQYVMPKSLMKSGLLCAAKFPEDNIWHRGTITGFRGDMIQIYYLDYGTTSFVTKDQLRILRTCFARLPAQAIRARLANIQPVNGVWSQASYEFFMQCIYNRPLMGFITDISRDGLVSLHLTDTNGMKDFDLNDGLISKGFAVRKLDVYESGLSAFRGRDHRDALVGESLSDPESLLSENEPVRSARADTKKTVVLHVKFVQLTVDYSCHFVMMRETLYITSTEVSSFLWTEDLVQSKLLQIGYEAKIPSCVLNVKDHLDDFDMLRRSNVPRVFLNGQFVKYVVLYDVASVISILNIFAHQSNNLKESLFRELKLFNCDRFKWSADDTAKKDAGCKDSKVHSTFPESSGFRSPIMNYSDEAKALEQSFQAICEKKERLESLGILGRENERDEINNEMNRLIKRYKEVQTHHSLLDNSKQNYQDKVMTEKSMELPAANADANAFLKKPKTNAVAPITQTETHLASHRSNATESTIQPVPPGFLQLPNSFPTSVSESIHGRGSPLDGLVGMVSQVTLVDPMAHVSTRNLPNFVSPSFRLPPSPALGLGFALPSPQLSSPFPGYSPQILQHYAMQQSYLNGLQELNSLMVNRLPLGHSPYNSSLLGLANLSFLAQANQPMVTGNVAGMPGALGSTPVGNGTVP